MSLSPRCRTGFLLVLLTFLLLFPFHAAQADSSNAPLVTRQYAGHLSAGVEHNCVRFVDAMVRCWGANTWGEVGVGNVAIQGDQPGEIEALAPLALGGPVKSVSTGYGTSCAMLESGVVKCWGWNNRGQLGLGDTGDRGDSPGEIAGLASVDLGSGRTATAVSASSGYRTCALLDNATIKCWGENNFGQLGIGTSVTMGDNAGEMGDALPAISLGTGRTATEVAVGYEHTCALLDNTEVKCWGGNGSGQLGLGDLSSRGGIATQMGDGLATVPLGRSATAIGTGGDHTCALLDNGSIKCWGSNVNGQLGTGDGQGYGDGTQPMSALPNAVLPAGRTATALALGESHTCAILDNGQVSCWGDNSFGQLGNSAAAAEGVPTAAFTPVGATTVVAIDAGEAHTCASLSTGAVTCWGENDRGQLGTNSVVDVAIVPSTPINVRSSGQPLLVELPLVPTSTTNRFVAVTPARIVDSRTGLGVAAGVIAPGATRTVQVAGSGGVPASGATAVVLNVTATATTGAGYITVWPNDVSQPTASNLNIMYAGQTVANLVTVRLPADGKVRVFTAGGGHIIADVAGYFTPATTATAGRFVPMTPTRILDTRNATGAASKIARGGIIDVTMLGRAFVPAAGVSAVALNVTATQTTGAGFVTAWPSGTLRPIVSNLNAVAANQTIANQVIVPVGVGGKVSFFSDAGTHLIADVAGYFTDSTVASAATGLFTPVSPTRLLDTRSDAGRVKLAPGTDLNMVAAGRGGLPATGMSAAVINVTITSTTTGGFVTAWPNGATRHDASTLNATGASQTIPNHAIVKVGAAGDIRIYCQGGAHVIADSAGWYN